MTDANATRLQTSHGHRSPPTDLLVYFYQTTVSASTDTCSSMASTNNVLSGGKRTTDDALDIYRIQRRRELMQPVLCTHHGKLFKVKS
jgi:hypothetical protein